MKDRYDNLFFSITLHICLLFTFLSAFFWLVISKTETRSINRELEHTINKIKNMDLFKNIPNRKEIKQYLIDYFSDQNKSRQKNNDLLFTMNICIIVLLFVVLLAVIYVRVVICKESIPVYEIIIENILILLFVGALEYFFFQNIASKYAPVDPSYLTESLEKYIKNA